MKTIGLIGGMSWESTVPYYRDINEAVKARLGGLHSAQLVLFSVDFDTVARLQREDRWEEAADVMVAAARSLAAAGADLIVLATNTMHEVAPAIEAAAPVPLLHIADPTAAAIKAAGLSRVGLLGTRFTMERLFYRDRLRDLHGIETIVPEESDRAEVHRVIYEELALGVLRDDSRSAFVNIIARLVDRGAQGIILGCTEIALLVSASDSPVPLYDTGTLHARAAVDRALG